MALSFLARDVQCQSEAPVASQTRYTQLDQYQVDYSPFGDNEPGSVTFNLVEVCYTGEDRAVKGVEVKISDPRITSRKTADGYTVGSSANGINWSISSGDVYERSVRSGRIFLRPAEFDTVATFLKGTVTFRAEKHKTVRRLALKSGFAVSVETRPEDAKRYFVTAPTSDSASATYELNFDTGADMLRKFEKWQKVLNPLIGEKWQSCRQPEE